MPFMKGPAPIRRTIKYLDSGKLVFKDRVKVMSINFNHIGKHNVGAKEFVFWYLPKIMWKNPDVQVAIFKNFTPSPFIRIFLDKDEEVLIDVDGKNKDEIYSHLTEILGKSEKTLAEEARAREENQNPANFGVQCDRHCMCEIPGQVPCPGIIKFPNYMRGKFDYGKRYD